jgi:Uncharacterized conserved protein
MKETSLKFRPNNSILLVEQKEILKIEPANITMDLVGQKAYGLCSLPLKWTLPYFVISGKLLELYRKELLENKDEFLKQWISNIECAANLININKGDEIIIRSSGFNEGLDERGKYYSENGILLNVLEPLKICLDELIADEEITERNIPLILQKYISNPKEKGHLSNERRLFEENRDWIGEFENKSQPFNIRFRPWRTDTNIESFYDQELECVLETDITKTLQIPVAWIYYNKARVHFEWLWNDNRILIVQADKEHEIKGINPIIKKSQKPSRSFRPECLITANENLAERFHKIQNVFIYKKLDLHTADLYILNDKEEIKKLAKGQISTSLQNDLKELSKEPLVIRMDLDTKIKEKFQLLPRTEVQSYEEALTWLFEHCHECENKYQEDVILIFHNFIPASAAAFAYAEPNKRIVYIEALWGLPEGLYYNANDKYTVDTMNTDFNEITKKNFVINIKRYYKNFFIAPDNNGQWVRQRLDKRYNWKGSIEKEDWIRDIAYVSRQIANCENKSLSIMWFIDVGDHVCSNGVFPWFHEQYDYIKSEKFAFRPKTVLDKATVIRNEKDLDDILQDESENQKIKCIRILPNEDKSLRDKGLLQKLGEIAKKIDATILLEGGVLSHAYYQLIKTGASVEIVYPFEDKENIQEFNKLVRDKIPENILKKGERVFTYQLTGDELLNALRHKLIEESVEVLDAIDPDSILAELADLNEVIDGILHYLNCDRNKLEVKQRKKREKLGGFEQGIVLSKTKNPTAIQKNTSLADEIEFNQRKLAKLPDKINKWDDKREHEDTIQYITRILVPFFKEKWDVDFTGSTRTLFGDNYIMQMKGKRIGVSTQIEVSIYKYKQEVPVQLSFFEDD